MFPDLTCDDIFRLETKRLWLRWPRACDAPAIRSFASLPETAQMTAGIPHPYPPGEAERFIFRARADNANGEALVLAITQKNAAKQGAGHAIGLVSAMLSDAGEIEFGFMVAPFLWSKGYATEAARALVEALFALTGAERILANVRAENPASRRVLEKCGFTYVDSGLDLLPARGGLHSCDRFQLGRNRWAANRSTRRLPAMAHQAPDEMAAILALAQQSQA
ncbi:MAG: GNAT family N-acetyltransferase [Methylocella sp.]